MAWVEWNVPCLPVKPWQMTRVFWSTQTLAVDDMDRTEEAAVVVVVPAAEEAVDRRRAAAADWRTAAPTRDVDSIFDALVD